AHLHPDVAAPARQREQSRAPAAPAHEAFLLAPRVVRDRRDAELPLHLVRGEVLSLGGGQYLRPLLHRVCLSCALRHASSESTNRKGACMRSPNARSKANR